ncbi:YhjD/YihY/BrkB family envelope integrity protein [Natronoglomus mannanivorans]|uniref:YihY family inner membrane protein n=1 Tax=Natronoglomus mannanivorans TaxID=2979990 RepID=A0AAP2YVJ2_9EURY|nr:YihY family inner membrane protein [Halobacteria archaeon AArc-xg1-1]
MVNVRRVVPVTKAVIGGIQKQNVSFMAASIAYQAFLSLIPLLVLLFFLVSILGDEGLAAEVTAMTEGFMPESGNQLLEDTIEGSVATAGTSIIGIVTLVWGSLKIFRGLDTAFSEIYASTAENSIVSQIRDGLIVFGAIVLAVVAAAGATVVFTFFPQIPFIGLLNPLLLVVGLTVAFYPMYYFFPDVEVTKREILPGVVVAAVGWATLQALFQVYVALSGGSTGGEILGAVILLLTWLYFGGFVLLIGAVVNATVGGQLPSLEETDDDVDIDDGRREELEAASEAKAEAKTRRIRRELEHLEARYESLERDHARLERDLDAQRGRRYDLEDANAALEERIDDLERENEALRARLELRRRPPWKRAVRWLAGRTTVFSVGTVERDD